MSDFEKQIAFELSKKYAFENFNFKTNSPQGLLESFQEAYDKIEKVIEDQNTEITKKSLKAFSKISF